jgi:hypothetical protein
MILKITLVSIDLLVRVQRILGLSILEANGIVQRLGNGRPKLLINGGLVVGI